MDTAIRYVRPLLGELLGGLLEEQPITSQLQLLNATGEMQSLLLEQVPLAVH